MWNRAHIRHYLRLQIPTPVRHIPQGLRTASDGRPLVFSAAHSHRLYHDEFDPLVSDVTYQDTKLSFGGDIGDNTPIGPAWQALHDTGDVNKLQDFYLVDTTQSGRFLAVRAIDCLLIVLFLYE